LLLNRNQYIGSDFSQISTALNCFTPCSGVPALAISQPLWRFQFHNHCDACSFTTTVTLAISQPLWRFQFHHHCDACNFDIQKRALAIDCCSWMGHTLSCCLLPTNWKKWSGSKKFLPTAESHSCIWKVPSLLSTTLILAMAFTNLFSTHTANVIEPPPVTSLTSLFVSCDVSGWSEPNLSSLSVPPLCSLPKESNLRDETLTPVDRLPRFLAFLRFRLCANSEVRHALARSSTTPF